MIVSVVNREVADDANSFIVDGRLVWLRVSRIDDVYAYHASIDGVRCSWSASSFWPSRAYRRRSVWKRNPRLARDAA
jgi:hypothetical protein